MTDNDVVWIFKPVGWTPADCVRQIKSDKKLAFVGRLDPMACGLMALVDNTNKTLKDELQNSYKTYRFKVILGLQSDTYDILGLGKKRQSFQPLQKTITELSSIAEQEYPPFSSKTVYSEKHGKMVQLWKLAKDGDLPQSLPKHSVDVKYIRVLKRFEVSNTDLYKIITDRIQTLSPKSDFRQQQILQQWEEVLLDKSEFTVFQCEARVSVGTYIRGLVNRMGGVVYDITRTSVDTISIDTHDRDIFKFQIL